MEDTQKTVDAATAGPSSEVSKDIEVEALEKLNEGKRNLACDEYPQAVDALAEACQLLASKYGEEGAELADAYYYYGRALLDLARMENGVLGNALDGVPAEEENEAELSESEQFEKASEVKDDERDNVRDQVVTAMSAEERETNSDDKTITDKADEKMDSETTEEKTDELKTETNDTTTETSEDKSKSEETSTEASAKATTDTKDATEEDEDQEEEAEEGEDEESADEANSSQDGEDNADDIPNLQLAWEVLELSKKIYRSMLEKEQNEALKPKLSEVYKTLAEVSLETGLPDQAIQDLSSCLVIQTQCLVDDSRYIAETHYQMGNAYLLAKNYPNAVESFRTAKKVLETRVQNLEAKLPTATDDNEKLQKELNDLKQLLPDVVAKVEDAEDEAKNAEKAESEVKAAILSAGSGSNTGFDSSTDSTPASAIPIKKANDISNLVRKRKPDEQPEEDAKKPKSEVNGCGDKENGHVESTPTPTPNTTEAAH